MVLENGIDNIKKFVIDNNIVGTSAGVCVALATKDSIQSLVSDIIIPTTLILLNSLNINSVKRYLPVNESNQLNISNFIKQLITFILIVVISFLFVNIAFGYLLGINNINKTENNQKNLKYST
jgi:large-conductance mechanosensitive channel